MVSLHGVRILWIDHYYDGPLAGVAEYQDRLHYFDSEWTDENEDWRSPRLLRLWSLTDEEIETFVRHFAEGRVLVDRIAPRRWSKRRARGWH